MIQSSGRFRRSWRAVICAACAALLSCAQTSRQEPRDDAAIDDAAVEDAAADAAVADAAPDAAVPVDAGADAGGDAATPRADSLSKLEHASDFAALAGPGAEVKYLSTVDGREPFPIFDAGPCLFQNTAKYPYHLEFLRSFSALSELSSQAYEDAILQRESRSLYGGMLKLFPLVQHPTTSQPGILVYTVYTAGSEAEQLNVEELSALDARLKHCVPFARDWLVYLPEPGLQLSAARQQAAELEAAGVTFIDPARLQAGSSAESYSEGEAYGYLKLAGDDPQPNVGPRDVLVIEAAPAELGLVAGLVTGQPQSVASHLNLRLREKGIPNAMSSALFENPVLQQWQELLVHLVVREGNVSIEPAQLSDAQAFWEQHQPPTQSVESDLERDAPAALAQLRHADAKAFGVKAANLGELARVLPEGNYPRGFAIPFRAYVDFLQYNELAPHVAELVADSELLTDAAYKRQRLKQLRDRFKAATVPPEWEETVLAAVQAAYGDSGLTTRLRFRSSTNAEDLLGVSGAGLYDSASGCFADDLDDDEAGPSHCLSEEQERHYRAQLQARTDEFAEHPEREYLLEILQDLQAELNEEKSARKALRKVWASLWNERAFDDRLYYGIEHEAVFMAMAVHPAQVGERLEAVALTNLEASSEQPLYRVVSQAGEVGVVEPSEPSTPEVQTLRRSADGPTALTLVASSSLLPDGEVLWEDSELQELAQLLFAVQDHFAAEVYPDLDPLALDVEVDVTAQGEILIKQARPYSSP